MGDITQRERERDLVLTTNEYAYINDTTKGLISTYVGPYKASLSQTDNPVFFDGGDYKFKTCSTLEQAKKSMCIAPQNFYVVLKNPATDGSHPSSGKANSTTELEIGKKVIIQGPCSFALYPGQMAQVIRGHQLRSNQYLIVRVYDEQVAKENWSKAVIKTVDGKETNNIKEDDISLGKHFVIKGTEVSFYVPPTGVEVLMNSESKYVRDAVTLERLEYCILLDESGKKRYEKGPMVVFPESTETFIQKDSSDKAKGAFRKFRAIELSDIKGIYVEVIEDYDEYVDNKGSFLDPEEVKLVEGKLPEGITVVKRKKGDELFITGKEQKIYFPRSEHALIKYGNSELHYAISIPPGKGRYVLDRITGIITTVKGPKMFLPDPRSQVMIARVLDANTVSLWYPGTSYDPKGLKDISNNQGYVRTTSTAMKKNVSGDPFASLASYASEDLSYDSFEPEKVGGSHNPDSIDRSSVFTPPRTINLDTNDAKYQQALSISVWSNYAIQTISKAGKKEVILGPATRILDYDEELEVINIACGNPKGTKPNQKTVYLRILNNRVSDTFQIETKDFVKANISLSYLVNFLPEQKDKWFDVENYTQYLSNHYRSHLKSVLKNYSIKEFYYGTAEILKKAILGDALEGKTFVNGMKVVDCEVLDIAINDASVFNSFVQAERYSLGLEVNLKKMQDEVTAKKKSLELQQDLDALTIANELKGLELVKERESKLAEVNILKDQIREDKQKRDSVFALAEIEAQKSNTLIQNDIDALQLEIHKKQLEIEFTRIEHEVQAIVKKAEVFTPQLVEAIRSATDKDFIARLTKDLAPLTVLGGGNIAEVMKNAFEGTGIESIFVGDVFTTLAKRMTGQKS